MLPVGAVSGSHHDNVRAGLEAVHESKELRHNTALHLAIDLVTLRGDGIDLVDEDDGRCVLLSLLADIYTSL